MVVLIDGRTSDVKSDATSGVKSDATSAIV